MRNVDALPRTRHGQPAPMRSAGGGQVPLPRLVQRQERPWRSQLQERHHEERRRRECSTLLFAAIRTRSVSRRRWPKTRRGCSMPSRRPRRPTWSVSCIGRRRQSAPRDRTRSYRVLGRAGALSSRVGVPVASLASPSPLGSAPTGSQPGELACAVDRRQLTSPGAPTGPHIEKRYRSRGTRWRPARLPGDWSKEAQRYRPVSCKRSRQWWLPCGSDAHSTPLSAAFSIRCANKASEA